MKTKCRACGHRSHRGRQECGKPVTCAGLTGGNVAAQCSCDGKKRDIRLELERLTHGSR